jgi:GxxExxY protein
MTREELNRLSKLILDACLTVHKEMGPGLLESIYVLCLTRELNLRGIRVMNEVSIPLLYKGIELSKDFRIDILVENEIVIEVK